MRGRSKKFSPNYVTLKRFLYSCSSRQLLHIFYYATNVAGFLLATPLNLSTVNYSKRNLNMRSKSTSAIIFSFLTTHLDHNKPSSGIPFIATKSATLSFSVRVYTNNAFCFSRQNDKRHSAVCTSLRMESIRKYIQFFFIPNVLSESKVNKIEIFTYNRKHTTNSRMKQR